MDTKAPKESQDAEVTAAVYVVCGEDGPVRMMAGLTLWSAGTDSNRLEDAKKIPGGRVVKYVPESHVARARSDGERQGREREREAVVKGLRDAAANRRIRESDITSETIDLLADAIERGIHAEPAPPASEEGK